MNSISKEEMQALDKAMVEQAKIPVRIMMEYAGYSVAKAVYEKTDGKVTILAGHGNNGGDALCAARHLINWGYNVEIVLATAKEKLKETPLLQLEILEGINANIIYFDSNYDFSDSEIIVDGLLGFNLEGNPKENYAALIKLANNSEKDIIAVDVPSGLDANTGIAASPCIIANQTITLAAAKKGLIEEKARLYVGKLFIGYLSVPDSIYSKFNLENPFKDISDPIIEFH